MIFRKNKSDLPILGSTEYVEIAGIKKIPAKIDTGADSSSIWASNIEMNEDGVLSFSLFGKKSSFYTGEIIKTTDYIVKTVRSSNGESEIRYRVKLPLVLGEKKLEASFTLSNRSRNNFPVLIGRRTLDGVFLVDVSKSIIGREPIKTTAKLNQELKEDPYKFHQKYIKK